MPAFPSQFDLLAGFDFSSLPQGSQAQLMQALNQMGPLSNIGLIIAGSGNAGANWPSLANNPRFANYIWLDTDPALGVFPIIKVKTGATDTYADWTATPIAANSIVTAMIQNLAITIAKLSSTGGLQGQLIQVNATGGFQFVDASTLFNVNAIPPNSIDKTGALNGQFLQYLSSDGLVKFRTFNPAYIPLNSILTSQLANTGNPYQVLASDGNQIVDGRDFDPSLYIADLAIPTTKIKGTGAPATKDILAWNGANWAKAGLGIDAFKNVFGPYQFQQTDRLAGTQVGGFLPAAGTSVVYQKAHGLPYGIPGKFPSHLQVYAICSNPDGSFALQDLVPIANFMGTNAGDITGCPISVTVDSVNITVSAKNLSTIRVIDKLNGNILDINPAKWNLIVVLSTNAT